MGVLYSSERPSQSSWRRNHLRSGISPSLVLAEDIEMIEKRSILLGRLLRRLSSCLYAIESRSGVCMEDSSRCGNEALSCLSCFAPTLTTCVSSLLFALALTSCLSPGPLSLGTLAFFLSLPSLLANDGPELDALLLFDNLVGLEDLEDLEDLDDLDDFVVDAEATELRDDLLSSR